MTDSSRKIAVIGLGYVGLPLAQLFATKYNTIGYDTNTTRVEELKMGHDSTMELSDKLLYTAIKTALSVLLI
jgi:UDP-N-acetyl-D-galactosamine dehydrogenase